MADDPPTFLCDAMLGGLARWLRAAGYDAEFVPGITDAALIERARTSGRVVLSSDGGLFERTVVKLERIRAVFVPRGLGTTGELGFVLNAMHLVVREPRCMTCGGELVAVAKDSVRDEAPPRTFEREQAFWRCARCARLLWRGTHWQRIATTLREAGGHADRPAISPSSSPSGGAPPRTTPAR